MGLVKIGSLESPCDCGVSPSNRISQKGRTEEAAIPRYVRISGAEKTLKFPFPLFRRCSNFTCPARLSSSFFRRERLALRVPYSLFTLRGKKLPSASQNESTPSARSFANGEYWALSIFGKIERFSFRPPSMDSMVQYAVHRISPLAVD